MKEQLVAAKELNSNFEKERKDMEQQACFA
jgi:hypothetical protein